MEIAIILLLAFNLAADVVLVLAFRRAWQRAIEAKILFTPAGVRAYAWKGLQREQRNLYRASEGGTDDAA